MKKRIAALLTALGLVFGSAAALPEGYELFGNEIMAEAVSSGNYEYTLLDNGTAEINKYKGNEANIIIPETIDGYAVSSIGYDAFEGCLSASSVSIPYGVTKICGGAFGGCKNLMTVSLPNTLEYLGEHTFYSCEKLDDIIIPSSVKSIGYEAFSGCSSLSDIDFDNGVEEIGNNAFLNCTALKAFYMPASVYTLGYEVFYGCSTLENIYVANSNSTFSSYDGALYNKDMTEVIYCPKGKSSLTIPNGVTTIGERALADCVALKSLVIPDSVNAIADDTVGVFFDMDVGEYVKVDGFKITCNYGSLAADYAAANGLEYEALGAPVHTHSYAASITKEATCKTEGIMTYTCECGNSYTEKIVKKTTHTFGNWAVTKVATCKAEGEETRTCSVCGKKETRAVAKLAHNYTDKVVKPTLKAKGYTLHTCSLCGDSYKDNYKNKLVNDVSKATVSGISNKTYTGKAIKQSVTVKLNGKALKSGKDYTVAYKNNKAVGTATVTIAGKGSYKGKLSKTFKINPKKTAIKSISSPKEQQLKVTYSKVAGVSGYQIAYSTSSEFTKATTKTASSTSLSKVISGLTGGKAYYVKVRTYKTVKGKKYYSGYSAAKKVAVKKKAVVKTPSSSSASNAKTYILNIKTHVYHLYECSAVKRMNAENKKSVKTTEQELKNQGYVVCGTCLN